MNLSEIRKRQKREFLQIMDSAFKYERKGAERVSDTSRRQKAQNLIKSGMFGKGKPIYTFAILTSENPNALPVSAEENKRYISELETTMRSMRLTWFPIEGHYGSKEHSFIIYNITKDEAEFLAEKYRQQSYIFCMIDYETSWNDKTEELDYNGTLDYQFWEREKEGSPYKCTLREPEALTDIGSAEDLFSSIGKKFKFRIPFFDHACLIHQAVSLHKDGYEKLADSMRVAGMSKYYRRAPLGIMEYVSTHSDYKFNFVVRDRR